MSKLRLLAENFLIYGVGGVISKMVPLIMTPIIVRLMPDSACYGVNDLSNTIVSFASAIAVFGMYDAMFRYFFEDESEDYRKRKPYIGYIALCFYCDDDFEGADSRLLFGG